MLFDVFGPFTIQRHGKKKNITKASIADLRSQMDKREIGLADSCGCYVFAKRAGPGITPWYVGQACSLPMVKEALNDSNIAKYNDVLDDDKGTPLLFVLPIRTPGGKFRKRPARKTKLASLNFLEKWLIAEAIEKNPYLKNSQETRFLRHLHVVGIFNAKKGEATMDSRLLAKTMGF